MSKKVFGIHPVVPLSAAVRAGDFIFLSGQIPIGHDGTLVTCDIETQTKQVLDNITVVLKELGAGLSDVVKTTIWLTDPEDFSRFNLVYAQYFPDLPPARSCVGAPLMVDANVEIEVIAYHPNSD